MTDDTSTRSWDGIADDWVVHADANDYRNHYLMPRMLASSAFPATWPPGEAAFRTGAAKTRSLTADRLFATLASTSCVGGRTFLLFSGA